MIILKSTYEILKQLYNLQMSISTSVNGNRSKVKIVMLGDQSVGKTSVI